MRPTGPQGLIRRRFRIRARAGRAASAPGAIARKSRRIDILCPSIAFPASRGMVNRTLPGGGVMPGLLAESRARRQGANMSAKVTFLAAAVLAAASPAAAAAACGGAISEFEAITASDANTGNLNKSVYGRIVA